MFEDFKERMKYWPFSSKPTSFADGWFQIIVKAILLAFVAGAAIVLGVMGIWNIGTWLISK